MPLRRRLFWILMCAGFSGVFIVICRVVWVHRFEIEAWWYCQQLASARSRDEAEPWFARLGKEPGREVRLAAAWDRFDRGEQWFDMWMMELSIFLSGGHPEDERDDLHARIIAREIEARPTIVEPMAHWLLWQGWLDPDQELSANLDLDPIAGEFYSNDSLLIFAHIHFWIVSMDDDRPKLTSQTKSEILATWHTWLTENGPYLRFDSTADRFRLDDDAKRAGQPVPREAQATTSIKTPFADWVGASPY